MPSGGREDLQQVRELVGGWVGGEREGGGCVCQEGAGNARKKNNAKQNDCNI
jgi:hypothetical protein